MNDRVEERELEVSDLSRLPLFQTDAPVASVGRRRSTFSLVRGSASVERIRAAAGPANMRPATPKNAAADTVPGVPDSQAGAAVEGELDWELVRALRVAASGQLMRALEGSSALGSMCWVTARVMVATPIALRVSQPMPCCNTR